MRVQVTTATGVEEVDTQMNQTTYDLNCGAISYGDDIIIKMDLPNGPIYPSKIENMIDPQGKPLDLEPEDVTEIRLNKSQTGFPLVFKTEFSPNLDFIAVQNAMDN